MWRALTALRTRGDTAATLHSLREDCKPSIKLRQQVSCLNKIRIPRQRDIIQEKLRRATIYLTFKSNKMRE